MNGLKIASLLALAAAVLTAISAYRSTARSRAEVESRLPALEERRRSFPSVAQEVDRYQRLMKSLEVRVRLLEDLRGQTTLVQRVPGVLRAISSADSRIDEVWAGEKFMGVRGGAATRRVVNRLGTTLQSRGILSEFDVRRFDADAASAGRLAPFSLAGAMKRNPLRRRR